MKNKPLIVGVGVDTLFMNVRYAASSQEPDQAVARKQQQEEHIKAILAQLELLTLVAKDTRQPQPSPWKHEGSTLHVQSTGTVTHHHLLKNRFLTLEMGPHLQNAAPARVRFSSEYLWGRGVDNALINTHAFLSSLFDDLLELQPSEMHLCVDVAGLRIPRDHEKHFVSRATKRRLIKEPPKQEAVYHHGNLQTLQFSGRRNPISATIYDKPAEIETKSKEKRWFYPLWKERGWDGSTPVWRIECRIKREALHEMDIEEVYQAVELIPSLWAYLVGRPDNHDGWLRMVTPNPQDTNRARWDMSPPWKMIQQAFLTDWRSDVDITELQREQKRAVNLDQAEKSIAGYTTTYAAWLQEMLTPDADVSVVLHQLYERMEAIWEKRGVNFQTLREQKKTRYNLS